MFVHSNIVSLMASKKNKMSSQVYGLLAKLFTAHVAPFSMSENLCSMAKNIL